MPDIGLQLVYDHPMARPGQSDRGSKSRGTRAGDLDTLSRRCIVHDLLQLRLAIRLVRGTARDRAASHSAVAPASVEEVVDRHIHHSRIHAV
jgi:hypothetical protein